MSPDDREQARLNAVAWLARTEPPDHPLSPFPWLTVYDAHRYWGSLHTRLNDEREQVVADALREARALRRLLERPEDD